MFCTVVIIVVWVISLLYWYRKKPSNRFCFKKKQLDRKELEQSVTYTLTHLCTNVWNQDIADILLKKFKCIKSGICIRQVDDPDAYTGDLDNRSKRLNEVYEKLGYVTSTNDGQELRFKSPSTSRTHRRKVHNLIKDAFNDLLNSHAIVLDNTYEHREGVLWNVQTEKVLTLDEFCDVITTEMILKWLPYVTQPLQGLDENDLCRDFEYAYKALTGRWAMEM